MEILHDKVNNFIITDPHGMVGYYLLPLLREQGPLRELTLFHCAGTDEDSDAVALNTQATSEMLSQLSAQAPLPTRIVYLSSQKVYSPDAGKDVDETRPTFAWSEAGRTRARTEMLMEKWASANGAILTIVRPALTFGKGVSGEAQRLFDRVIANRFVHIRGNDAMVSTVTALDVARSMAALAGTPGIFNISDGIARTWPQIAEAMTANAGAPKRPPVLPEKWAAWIWRIFGRLPMVRQMLSPEVLEPMTRTLTLDNSRVRQATGIEFFDTLAVIARTDRNYPYEDS